MSETITPLVAVSDAGPRTMLTLRGDLSSNGVRSLATGLTGLDFPAAGHCHCVADKALCWMSPDELLLILSPGKAPAALSRIDTALAGTHHLAVDVSDARKVIRLEGAGLREVLARLAPVDLHPDSFRPLMFRRTHLGQVAAAFWMHDQQTADVIVFRSVADYALRLLQGAAAAGPVGHF